MDSTPQREIGVGKDGEVILKMPFNENYGYWVYNNLTCNDFKESFKIEYISKENFEKAWNNQLYHP